MLSRAYLPEERNCQTEFEQINMVSFLPIRDERLQQIRKATEQDDVSNQLRQKLTATLHQYYNIRDEMTVQDGLVFKDERVLIPLSLRSEIKRAIHSSHKGIDGCLRRARECVFWPGMSADIREYVSTCETCCKFSTEQPKETLMQHNVPDRPWQKIGVDLFSFESIEYLITVDYFSNFWEIDRLDDTTATTVIRKLKAHFARYGIPCQVVSDPGPQFSSSTFQHFSEKWDFEHLLASPANQQCNGKAESAVKSAKRFMRKNKDTNSDQFLALLDFRNTPTQAVGSSPSQRLLNRQTRSLLPMTSNLLKTRSVNNEERDKRLLDKKQEVQASYFNKRARDLAPLDEGDSVKMQPYIKGDRRWKRATVRRRLDERSYEVETSEGLYRRNRRHLRKSAEAPVTTTEQPTVRSSSLDGNSEPVVEPAQSTVSAQVAPALTTHEDPAPPRCEIKTRAGRDTRRPSYLKDYVKK